MKNGKTRKTVLAALALLLVAAASVGGTLAWISLKTNPVTNTFTAGDINITLAETKTDFKMVPGNAIDKDPVVTVESGSEACWLFIKVEESENLDDFIKYAMDNDWVPLTGKDGVYYQEVGAIASTDSDKTFGILAAGSYTPSGLTTTYTWADNQVLVLPEVTKGALEVLGTTDHPEPTLTFTAFAVQKDNLTVENAWAEAESLL